MRPLQHRGVSILLALVGAAVGCAEPGEDPVLEEGDDAADISGQVQVEAIPTKVVDPCVAWLEESSRELVCHTVAYDLEVPSSTEELNRNFATLEHSMNIYVNSINRFIDELELDINRLNQIQLNSSIHHVGSLPCIEWYTNGKCGTVTSIDTPTSADEINENIERLVDWRDATRDKLYILAKEVGVDAQTPDADLYLAAPHAVLACDTWWRTRLTCNVIREFEVVKNPNEVSEGLANLANKMNTYTGILNEIEAAIERGDTGPNEDSSTVIYCAEAGSVCAGMEPCWQSCPEGTTCDFAEGTWGTCREE